MLCSLADALNVHIIDGPMPARHDKSTCCLVNGAANLASSIPRDSSSRVCWRPQAVLRELFPSVLEIAEELTAASSAHAQSAGGDLYVLLFQGADTDSQKVQHTNFV